MTSTNDKDIILDALLLQIRALKAQNESLAEEVSRLQGLKVLTEQPAVATTASEAPPVPPRVPEPTPAKPVPAPKAHATPTAKTTATPATTTAKATPTPKAPATPTNNALPPPKAQEPAKPSAITVKTDIKGPFDPLRQFFDSWESDTPVSLVQLDAIAREKFPEVGKYAAATVQRHVRDVLDKRVTSGSLQGNIKGYFSTAKSAESIKTMGSKGAMNQANKRGRAPSLTDTQSKELASKAEAWVNTYWKTHDRGTYGDIVASGAASLGIKVTSKWQEFVQVALKARQAAKLIDSAKAKGWFKVS